MFDKEKDRIMDIGRNGLYVGSYAKWMKDMLRSRCGSHMARSMFPDLLGGLSYTPEDFNVHSNDGVLEFPPEYKED